jgi:tRNA pseudouridine55 synthase
MRNLANPDFSAGEVLLIDKPLKWTSFDVVNKLRYKLQKQLGIKGLKVGHAGTLDPLASGLLIVCTGKMTKRIDEFQGQEKEYTGELTLGATTPSYDLETQPDTFFPTNHITESLIQETAKSFIGTSHQLPPIFSAKKVDGKRAYEKARKGEEVIVKTKEVTISDFEITAIEMPKVRFRVSCSKGTYIRSIAYDFGKALNSGAYLSALTRTRIGNFYLHDSISIEAFVEFIDGLTAQGPGAEEKT